jgi:tripartite motif-containing protein 71
MKIIKFITIGLIVAVATSYSGCKKDDKPDLPNNPDVPNMPELIDFWNVTLDGWDKPWGIAIGNTGNIYTSELDGSRISKFTTSGTLITRWGTSGGGNGQFFWPKYLAVDKDENIYVADEKNRRIQKFDSSGNYITKWEVDFPGNVAVDRANNWAYTIDVSNVLKKFDLTGNFISQWGGTGSGDGQFMITNQIDPSNQGPNGQMAVDGFGNVYVVDNMNFRVQKFSSSSNFILRWGTNGSGSGQFLFPCGIAIDNENGFVYVSDNSRGGGGSGSDNTARIQKFDLSGTFIRQWITTDNDGNGVLALAVDNEGNVLAIQGSRVLKFDFQ